jgi:hypothetical protein
MAGLSRCRAGLRPAKQPRWLACMPTARSRGFSEHVTGMRAKRFASSVPRRKYCRVRWRVNVRILHGRRRVGMRSTAQATALWQLVRAAREISPLMFILQNPFGSVADDIRLSWIPVRVTWTRSRRPGVLLFVGRYKGRSAKRRIGLANWRQFPTPPADMDHQGRKSPLGPRRRPRTLNRPHPYPRLANRNVGFRLFPMATRL